MTIDELAASIANGFLEAKQERAELKAELKAELTATVNDEIRGVEHRLGAKIDALRTDVNELFYDGKKMKQRVEKLEDRVFGSIQAA